MEGCTLMMPSWYHSHLNHLKSNKIFTVMWLTRYIWLGPVVRLCGGWRPRYPAPLPVLLRNPRPRRWVLLIAFLVRAPPSEVPSTSYLLPTIQVSTHSHQSSLTLAFSSDVFSVSPYRAWGSKTVKDLLTFWVAIRVG